MALCTTVSRAALIASLVWPASAPVSAFAADAPAAAPSPAPAAPAAPAPAAADKPAEAAPEADLKGSTLADSLVRLTITTQAPDIAHPWMLTKEVEALGTGVCIKYGGKSFVLISGAAVNYATKIEAADGTRFKVDFASPSAQLALLTPKTGADAYFKNHPGLELDDNASDIVFAGFGLTDKAPIGIQGKVGAFQVNGAALTAIAAIRPDAPQAAYGPAIAGGKVVGLLITTQPTPDRKGVNAAFTPAAEIKSFLEDVKDGRLDGRWGFKNPKVVYKSLVNPALRAKLGVKGETEGLLVGGEAAEIAPFKPGDILTKIGPVAVDNDGASAVSFNGKSFKGGAFSAFYHINGQAKADGTLPVTVVRDGKPVELALPLSRRGAELMPSLVETGAQPRYFVWGPMCFEQASAELAQALAKGRGPELVLSGNPIGAHLNDNTRSAPDEEIVVLSNLFEHDLTRGYAGGGFPAVKSVNGKAVTSLRQLAQLLADAKEEFVEIAFHDRNAETLVFKRADLSESNREIRRKNGISEFCSEDLKDVVK